MVNGQRSINSIFKGSIQGLDETLVTRIDYLSIIPNPIRKLKSDFLNMSDCFGHNFCYTYQIFEIQYALERRLQDLNFICFTLFHWRSLRGSKSGFKVRVVICQLQFSNQDQEFYLYLFCLDEFQWLFRICYQFYIPHCLRRDLCFCSYLYKAMFWLKYN